MENLLLRFAIKSGFLAEIGTCSMGVGTNFELMVWKMEKNFFKEREAQIIDWFSWAGWIEPKG